MGYENIEILIEEFIGSTTTIEYYLSHSEYKPFFMGHRTFKYKIDEISDKRIILLYLDDGKIILNKT